MNAIFFGLKRAFHGVLRITRRSLGVLGLTAARFDLLYAAYEHARGVIPQRELRARLGVSATVVSRMLKSLEALGLVVREQCGRDRRQRWVRLTTTGRSRIRLAIWRMIRTGQAQLAVDSALAGDRWFDAEACFRAISALDAQLRCLRAAYRDTATLYYRWHPDD